MKTYPDMDNEHNIGKSVFVSAVLHILFVLIVILPFRAKETEYTGYVVSLVPPKELTKTRKKDVSERSSVQKGGGTVRAEPENGQQEEGAGSPGDGDMYVDDPPENVPAEDPGKAVEKQKNAASRLLSRFDEKSSPAKKEYSIEGPGRKDHTDPVPIERGMIPVYREPEATGGKQYVIAGNNSGKQPAPVPEFARPDLYEGIGTQERTMFPEKGYTIDRKQKDPGTRVRKERGAGAMEAGNIMQTLRGDRDVREQQYMIARNDTQTRGRSLSAPAGYVPGDNAVDGRDRNVEFDSLEQETTHRMIGTPGGGKSKPGETAANKEMKAKQIIKNNTFKEEKEKYENDNIASDGVLSIRGVPLASLTACKNALDERMLKKRILRIVGDRRECVSPDIGRYIFLKTGRFTSFDMIILPASGRKLSNRCDELRHAFYCLDSAGR